MTYDCEVCKDATGYLVAEQYQAPDGSMHEREAWHVCECVVRKRVAKLIRKSHITPEFQIIDFGNFTIDGKPRSVAAAYRMAKYYLQDFEQLRFRRQNSMALLGPPGSGKSHLLIAVANQLIVQGISVMYFPWVTGSNDLRGDNDSINNVLQAMRSCDVLYIDDLFQGRMFQGRPDPTTFQKEFLYDVVNDRYLNHRPLLVSSEHTIDVLLGVSETIGSRIYEMCKSFIMIVQLTEEERSKGMILNHRLAGMKAKG